MLKKSHPGPFQLRKPKMRFPSCSQNQGLRNQPSILVARPWAPQAVFQQPANSLLIEEKGQISGVVKGDRQVDLIAKRSQLWHKKQQSHSLERFCCFFIAVSFLLSPA